MPALTLDQIISKKIFFQRLEKDKQKKLTLVLDLDETLIHTVDNNVEDYDAEVETEDSGRIIQV